MRLKKTFSDWLTHRYQLVVRDRENLAEKHTFGFSYARLISLGTVLLSILLMCSLALATTILAKWLNPAYIERENEKKLIQLATAVDALEEQTAQQKKFITLLQSIIAGKEPPANELSTVSQKQTKATSLPFSPVQLADASALLQGGLENSESPPATSYKDFQQPFFFPPINDDITTPFKHSVTHYGVDAVANKRKPIKCVADGVVIFSAWTVETGWGIVIQHNKDLISTYKHNATLLKKVGNFVKKGEIIAMMDNLRELSIGPHLHFELWYRGKAVDSEYFVTF